MKVLSLVFFGSWTWVFQDQEEGYITFLSHAAHCMCLSKKIKKEQTKKVHNINIQTMLIFIIPKYLSKRHLLGNAVFYSFTDESAVWKSKIFHYIVSAVWAVSFYFVKDGKCRTPAVVCRRVSKYFQCFVYIILQEEMQMHIKLTVNDTIYTEKI